MMKRLFREVIDDLIYVGQLFYAVFLTLLGIGLALLSFYVTAKFILSWIGIQL